ncbi:MAG TPA: response regulator transcription factor [Chloroflexota bacterium]|nr:response regulator transcription factor [Chloroflexota bacterium]
MQTGLEALSGSSATATERPPRVLAVDDEPRMVDFLRVSLHQHGFQVQEASTGEEALQAVRNDFPDLVLLDVALPDMDGFDVLQRLRLSSSVPVIIVTVHSDESDRIHGLTLGADDYVSKPFSPAELAARIKAVLRRTAGTEVAQSPLVTIDERLQIDFEEREAIVEGRRLRLRPTEHRLLYHLVQNAGRTLSFETILARVWGPEYREESHYVHLYITYLRQKIEPDPANPRYILSKRGVGYSFRALPARQLDS